MKEKILLFDLDGTLIDSTEAILESFLIAASNYDLDLQKREEEIRQSIGMPLKDMFLKMGIPQEKLQECVGVYRHHYQERFLQKTSLLPKVKELIEGLPKSYMKGIVTSKSHFFSEKILQNFKMLNNFFTLVGIDDVVEPKPSAEPILKALEGLKYDCSRVFMIGDTMFDMQAAKNAGIVGIGVNGLYQNDLHQYTNFVFENMEDALTYIHGIE